MLTAIIENVLEWKAVLNGISDLAEESMFVINFDGITFRGIDPSHVALFDITFPKSTFQSFKGDTSFFGLRIDDFKTIMNMVSVGDTMKLSIDKSNTMNILISGSLTMEYNIRLLEKSQTNFPIPKTPYKTKISLRSSTLNHVISNLQNISEDVKIICYQDRLEFSGKGDASDAKIDLERKNSELEIESTENSSAIYSLEHMVKVIRDLGKASELVKMEYATGTPIHIGFEMPSAAKVELYLAPKTED